MKLSKLKKYQLEYSNTVFGGSTIDRIAESNQVNAPFTFGGLLYPNVKNISNEFYVGDGEFNQNGLGG
ncbi:hypothetical protein [uncultured Dokdonia sp.]|uniref:hypothetical protein n=1 Tax=uncultured Dokdonia sp. TaxID=575653 RepID=UPI0026059F2C|nr:hypothetical protein [uncultured Dokdonia sp.]